MGGNENTPLLFKEGCPLNNWQGGFISIMTIDLDEL